MTPLEQLRQLVPPFSPRFKRRTRRIDIEERATEIAELIAMRSYAEGNDVFTDAQRRDLDNDISSHRHAILAQLTVDELRRMKAKDLQPESATSILEEESAPSPELQKLQKSAWAAHAAEISGRSYFTAEKGFSGTLSPGVSVETMIANYPEQHRLINRWKTPSRAQQEPAYTIADSALNHRPDLQNK